jgi:CBS domain-containing protein
MLTVSSIMSRESLVTLQEGESLEDAGQYLRLAHVRHLPVVHKGNLVGLLTQRDWLRALMGHSPADAWKIFVRDVMTRDVQTVTPDTPMQEAVALMLDNKFGCLPVVDPKRRLLGIVTETDLLRFASERVREMDLRELSAEYDADA